MDGSEALESDTQAAEVVHPGVGSFDDPAGFPEASAMGRAAPSDLSGDASRVQGFSILVMVVAAIGLDKTRLGKWSAALAADWRNGVDQRQKLSHVVTVGAGEDHRKR